MPAQIVIKESGAHDSIEVFEERLRTVCRKHYTALTEVRIDRRNRGRASGPIFETVEVTFDPAETADELADDTTKRVLEVIKRDAGKPRGRSGPNAGKIGAWEGTAILLNTNAKAAKERELCKLELEIEDPDAVLSMESAQVEFVSTMTKTIGALGKVTVDLFRASEKKDRYFSRALRSMAKGHGKRSKAQAKYDHKARKEEERTARIEATAHERSAKSRARWEAFESVAVEYKDVAKVVTEYFTQGRKPGDPKKPPPKRPTEKEFKELTEHPAFEVVIVIEGQQESVKALIALMLAEAMPRARMKVAKRLGRLQKLLPEDTRKEIENHMIGCVFSELLTEARLKEIIAWLSLPIT